MSLLNNPLRSDRTEQGTSQPKLSLMQMIAASNDGYPDRFTTSTPPTTGVVYDGDTFWKPTLSYMKPCISLDPTDELPTGCGLKLFKVNLDISRPGPTPLTNYDFEPFAVFNLGFADNPSASCKAARYVGGVLVDHFFFNKIEQVWGPPVDLFNPYDLDVDCLDAAALLCDPRAAELVFADFICDQEANMGLFHHPV